MVVFGQNWLYSSKRGCIRATMFVFVLSDFIRMKVVVLGNVVVYRAGLLYRGKMVVFEKKLLYSGKSCCYSDKRGCIQANVVVFG